MAFLGLLKDALNQAPHLGDLYVEIGNAAFSTTNSTVEVPTNLSEVLYAVCFPDNSATHNANDLLRTDKTITSGAVTVARGSSGTSGLSFTYIFIGRMSSTS